MYRRIGFRNTAMLGIGTATLILFAFPFLPYPGAVGSSPSADSTDAIYASSFSHANETGTAGYYRVNDECVACFPTAADVVMGRPAPARPDRVNETE